MPQFTFKLPGGKKPDVADTPTDQDLLTYEAASDQWIAQAGAAGGGGFTTVYKSADETINSDTTLSDDSDLKFSVDASSFYAFKIFAMATSSSGADFKHAFSVPAGATIRGNYKQNEFYNGAPNNNYETLDMTASLTASLSATEDDYYVITGFVETDTTAGTVAYQWAQNTSTPDNCTIHKGSWMMYKKLN